MLEHGGGIDKAARTYGIEVKNWLDLSTGINPEGWPVPEIPADCWQRLPSDDDDLFAAASAYYLSDKILPVAGSQAAIRALPLLRKKSCVGIIEPTYNEHYRAWSDGGHTVVSFTESDANQVVDQVDVLVLCSPNNPTGRKFPTAKIIDWSKSLDKRQGWLVVDEAFMDANPNDSLLNGVLPDNIIVLRSMGKFWGLAGARVGFVVASREILMPLRETLGPWTVTGPSRFVAIKALNDHSWQNSARLQLILKSMRLSALLSKYGFMPSGTTAYFNWIVTDEAQALYESLAKQGILIRKFDQPKSVRVGLPGKEEQWARLTHALEKYRRQGFEMSASPDLAPVK